MRVKVPRPSDDWAGATAFVVAAFLAIGWAVSMIVVAIDDNVSEAGIQLLTGLGGVLAGAVAGYLGAGAALIWRRHKDDEPPG